MENEIEKNNESNESIDDFKKLSIEEIAESFLPQGSIPKEEKIKITEKVIAAFFPLEKAA